MARTNGTLESHRVRAVGASLNLDIHVNNELKTPTPSPHTSIQASTGDTKTANRLQTNPGPLGCLLAQSCFGLIEINPQAQNSPAAGLSDDSFHLRLSTQRIRDPLLCVQPDSTGRGHKLSGRVPETAPQTSASLASL